MDKEDRFSTFKKGREKMQNGKKWKKAKKRGKGESQSKDSLRPKPESVRQTKSINDNPNARSQTH